MSITDKLPPKKTEDGYGWFATCILATPMRHAYMIFNRKTKLRMLGVAVFAGLVSRDMAF